MPTAPHRGFRQELQCEDHTSFNPRFKRVCRKEHFLCQARTLVYLLSRQSKDLSFACGSQKLAQAQLRLDAPSDQSHSLGKSSRHGGNMTSRLTPAVPQMVDSILILVPIASI